MREEAIRIVENLTLESFKLRGGWQLFGRLGVLPFAFLAIVINGNNSLAQSVSIFGNTVPDNPVEADYAAVTLGVTFTSTQAGQITGVRFYRGDAKRHG